MDTISRGSSPGPSITDVTYDVPSSIIDEDQESPSLSPKDGIKLASATPSSDSRTPDEDMQPQQTSATHSKIVIELNSLNDKGHQQDVDIDRIPAEEVNDALPHSNLSTGLCYDVRMRYHATVVEDDVHPEDPRRIFRIYEILREAGLVKDPNMVGRGRPPFLARIDAREATKAEVCLIHTAPHWDFIAGTSQLGTHELKELTDSGDSVYYSPHTFFSAKLSVGGAIECCKAVVAGRIKNAIAVIRPPGHHAVPSDPSGHEAQGFCIFNNVSIAARVCQRDFPKTCRKILIFDWDVHHGNGTQDAFYDDPNVLYISIHVYRNGNFYPSSPKGSHTMCGRGNGTGTNVNIAWSDQGMADGDYMYAFQALVMPIASEFDPDLVISTTPIPSRTGEAWLMEIVSAGFDAAAGDEIGGCFVNPACYAHMLHGLMSLADGKVVVCLEGGYNLESISKSALAVTRTLMGEPPERMGPLSASALAEADVQKAIRVQSAYWHYVIRYYQSQRLYDEHKMVSLMILRNRLSTSFRNQVIATSNYAKTETLIFVLHDPPEILGITDFKTNKLVSHDTWIADVVKNYVKWAIESGYGVIDVNIPKYLTDIDDKETTQIGEEPVRVQVTKELVLYLWDNYIELNEASNVFILGVGEACAGVMHLLNHRDCSRVLRGVVSFIGEEPLRSVKRDADPFFPDWYYKNSLVFVSASHTVWEPDRRRPKRKFGRIVKSTGNSLSEMLPEHQAQVASWIEDRIAVESTEPPSLLVP
ncbi:MAG: hypothetical protein M1825_005539 [Sarcosagium campestre]|nr:MAG: hypothetical protein M1825_005539 [Sarcosagium campestre]